MAMKMHIFFITNKKLGLLGFFSPQYFCFYRKFEWKYDGDEYPYCPVYYTSFCKSCFALSDGFE